MTDSLRAKLDFDRHVAEALGIEARRIIAITITTAANDARVAITVEIFPSETELQRIADAIAMLPIDAILRATDHDGPIDRIVADSIRGHARAYREEL